MIVVGDSGPLLYLGAVGRLELLQSLYGTIVIPPEVRREVVDDGAGDPGAAELASAVDAGWVLVHEVGAASLRSVLLASLDAGEAAALALAVELGANLLLVDERKARLAAARLGVRVKGTLGVILSGKAAGRIDAVAPVIRELESAGLYLSDPVIDEVLRLAGEQRA